MIGRRVVVIYSNQEYSCSAECPFPPIGAIGTIISELDKDNEFDVVFDEYPWPGEDESWTVHRLMVVLLSEETNKEECKYQQTYWKKLEG